MDKIRRTAFHEAGHAVVAERLGIRVSNLTCVRRGRSGLGSVRVAGLRPESLETGVVLAAGYAAAKAFGPDCDGNGHRGDFKELDALCKRLASREPDLWREAHARAYQMVREPRVANAIEAVARELEAEAMRGFGMGCVALGRVIARANDEFDSRKRIYGMRAPRSATLAGCTPSEELARREATLRAIGASESKTENRHATTNPATRKQTKVPPGFTSPDGYIAAQTFGVLIGGRPETVKAGKWFPNGHPVVVKYPAKFRASGRKKPA